MDSKYLREIGGGGLSFWCAGCKEAHVVWVRGQFEPDGRPSWDWNGDAEKPVFSPSVLITSGHFMREHKAGSPCWCTYNEAQIKKGEEPSGFSCSRCHSFIGCNGAEPGQIIYLSDSTHKLAGQTLPLSELPPLRTKDCT